MPAPTLLDTLPAPQDWINTPETWQGDSDHLSISAGPSTNWFISPRDGAHTANGPTLLFRPAQEFVLTAKLTAELPEQWDAGMLMVYVNDRTWAKLAFEKSIYLEPTIISVVTRDVSDDCNSVEVSGNSIWLRVEKLGNAIVFYYSTDGQSWRQVRVFTLGDVPDLRVGFGSQSPVGNGTTTVFSEVSYKFQLAGTSNT